MTELPTHSPLGASSAYRFFACPGAPHYSYGIVEEDSDFALGGTAAHALGEHCLNTGDEPWMLTGRHYVAAEKKISDQENLGEDFSGDVTIDKEMVDAVDFYVRTLEAWHPSEDRNQGNSFVEKRFHCPSLHEFFYGTSDFVYVTERVLDIWDYKHGAGIVVEATDNAQGMYYACGVLEELCLWGVVTKVRIHIVQPRGWHRDGPHRVWEVSAEDLRYWLYGKLLPSMELAEVSRDTKVGEHCRFCPVRSHQCPAMMDTLAELEELLIMAVEKEKNAEPLTPEQAGRLLELWEVGKIAAKAAQKVAHGYLNAGKDVPGVKLVKAKTNRTWKRGAENVAKKKFGTKCLTKPEFVSPAQLDALPGGKDFTARWAFKPEGATTVAVEGDPRSRINRDTKSLFTKKGK